MSHAQLLPDLDAAPLRSELLCERGSVLVKDVLTNKYTIIPVTCKSWACPHCAKRKQQQWAEKLRAGKPWLAITLTCRFSPYKNTVVEARKQKLAFHKLVTKIRKRFGFFEYAAVWELQKNGMPHVHILARAPYIPQAWLSKTWCELTGAFMVYIHRVSHLEYEARHSTKALPFPGVVKTYTPEHLVSKQTSQTAQALRPMRIIVLSKHYIDGAPGYEPEPEPDVVVAAFSMDSPEDLLETLHLALGFDLTVAYKGHVLEITPPPGRHYPSPLQIVTGRFPRAP